MGAEMSGGHSNAAIDLSGNERDSMRRM